MHTLLLKMLPALVVPPPRYLHINDSLQSLGLGRISLELVPTMKLLRRDPVKISLAAHHLEHFLTPTALAKIH